LNLNTLDALARSLTGPFAFCGIAVAWKGAKHFAVSHVPEVQADARSLFRVASISKIVVGQAVAACVETQTTSWDADVSDILGWSLRHPAYPDQPVTLGMVASHSAGLSADAGYLIPPEQSLQEWCQDQPVFAAQPGTRFSYANLGYIVLAETLERLTGKPFPEAVAPYLPARGGFNWIGVSAAGRAGRLPIYRRDGETFVPQIDGAAQKPGPSQNSGRYSPQGGLRLSLTGMLDLAMRLPQMNTAPLWTPKMGPGDYLDGVFESYGAGLQIFEHPGFYPRPLVGHFGNAYGFNGGVWWDAKRELAFAYALNGLEVGDEDDAFSTAERLIFNAVAQLKD